MFNKTHKRIWPCFATPTGRARACFTNASPAAGSGFKSSKAARGGAEGGRGCERAPLGRRGGVARARRPLGGSFPAIADGLAGPRDSGTRGLLVAHCGWTKLGRARLRLSPTSSVGSDGASSHQRFGANAINEMRRRSPALPRFGLALRLARSFATAGQGFLAPFKGLADRGGVESVLDRLGVVGREVEAQKPAAMSRKIPCRRRRPPLEGESAFGSPGRNRP